jgi:D-tagatose-bisphosphate aldolase class II non-catalytic subunit
MMQLRLDQLVSCRIDGTPRGITSVCSAHPVVLRAALRHGAQTGALVLIEATSNQVNHQGGYTGMTPAAFAALVARIADQEHCPAEQVLLGGDHLGPNPWRHLQAEEAMIEAEAMMAAYVEAGFRKIHLDASMGCAGEPPALDDGTTATRAARLAATAERVAHDLGGQKPLYIIGTEVPPPGGADHVLDGITPTLPGAADDTIAVHRKVFSDAGLSAVLERVIGLVVQPGVEFGNHNVIFYDRALATGLIGVLNEEPNLVFEAHSTDYQGPQHLAELVQDGFAFLKVGPELTFALREALYSLDLIASDLLPEYGDRPLFHSMEAVMQADPENWNRHYSGSDTRLLRHYSLSDRIRYYWTNPAAQDAVDRLMNALAGRTIPITLFWQHMPAAAHFADSACDPEEVLIWRITQCLATYHSACNLDS